MEEQLTEIKELRQIPDPPRPVPKVDPTHPDARLQHTSTGLSPAIHDTGVFVAPANGAPRNTLTLGTLFRLAIRQAFPVILLALAGFGVAFMLAPKFAARADIMIHLQQSGDAVVRYHSSQTVIIKNRSFLAPIAREMQVKPEDMERSLSVDFPKGGDIMRIEYSDHDPGFALEALKRIVLAWQTAALPVELEESAAHQIVASPAVLSEPVFPQPLQFAALGAAIGVFLSMANALFLRSPVSRRSD
jgi:capsular polysaccharide biosynthesis protein